MTGSADLRPTRRRIEFAVLGLLITLSPLLFAPKSQAAEAPYEPNDTTLSAAGPLAIGQTYPAGIEIPGDRDFFFFYVTSARPTQVVLTVRNLGGGSQVSDIDATIVDSTATPVGSLSFIRKGEERTVTTALEPQKYFVEVVSNEGYGDSYSLTTGGGNGAFGPYARIAGRCATARAAITAAQTGLGRAKSKLQRATARLRRTRYSGRDAHKAARAVHRMAKERVAAKRNALMEARESENPWCFIPQ